jgi:hypothetical protein
MLNPSKLMDARVRPREPGILVNVKLNLPSEFNLIWAVQSHPQK